MEKKIERKYRTKIPQSVPRSEITAIKSKFKDKKSILNNLEQTYQNKLQDMISNIRQTYSLEYDFLKREEHTARINLNNELDQFDKVIAEINKNLAGKQWELHHLSKQWILLRTLIS